MIYTKKDNYGNEINYIQIKKKELNKKYPEIDRGEEGIVYNYKNLYAFKILYSIKSFQARKAKIQDLMKIEDEEFCFPIGFLEYLTLGTQGHYVNFLDESYISLYKKLSVNSSISQKLNILIQIDEAIERIHKKGIIIGDVNPQNIMINEERKIKFIDTDSYIYGDYPIDFNYRTIETYFSQFGRNNSLIDCDKYWLGALAIAYLVSNENFIRCPFLSLLEISKKNFSKEVMDGLNLIFSDATNKPYIGPILKKMNSEQSLIRSESVYNWIR